MKRTSLPLQRREFITLLGGAAARGRSRRAAQQAAMPVIGFLAGQSREGRAYLTAALKQGLSETGYFEGQNASIEYRWAENQYDRLPEMAAELVNRKVAVIVAGPVPAALAAKAATADIPIVFAIGGDPVKSGLVASLNRPDGNVTGVSFFTTTLEPKPLDLFYQIAIKNIDLKDLKEFKVVHGDKLESPRPKHIHELKPEIVPSTTKKRCRTDHFW